MSSVNVSLSALWMLGAILAFSLTAIAGREATQVLNSNALSISQLVFFRNIVGLGIILTLLIAKGQFKQVCRSEYLGIHTGRNFAHFFGQWCWFYGLALLPLAQVFAIEFTVPIWTAIFASLILAEKLTRRRVVAIILGFVGVLIILRPGFIGIPWACWVVLASAVAYAFSHTLTKKLSNYDGVLTILFYMHVLQLPMALFLVSFDFSWPQGITWLFVVMTAIAALCAHYCMAKALTYADATLVMPMDFLRLPLIALVGYLLYDEGLDWWLLLGAAIMLFGNMQALREKPNKLEAK